MYSYLRYILVIIFMFKTVEMSYTTDVIAVYSNTKEERKQIFGTATWYAEKFHGRKTANGEIYNMHGLTCATRDRNIPFGSKLKITNIKTDKSIIVTVNDRMAKYGKHTIDLSLNAFKELAPRKQGVIQVKIENYAEDK